MIWDNEKLAESLRVALNQELPQVGMVRGKIKGLPKYPIDTDISNSLVVATVATDGGENRLVLEPIQVQIFRVMDSEGKKYFEDFIPLSLGIEKIYQFFFKSNDLIQSLVQELGIEWDDLLPKTSYQKSNLMGMMRELMEWTAILKLAIDPSGPILIVRDGLLRSVAIPSKAFVALENALQRAIDKNNHFLVGVAKRSRILNYLSFAISIDSILPKGQTGYIEISKDIEREAAPAQYRWHLADRSMGDLFLTRLANNSNAIYPIEIPTWLSEHKDKILANLASNAQGSFPDPGYPKSLAKAHRLAHIGGIEIEIIERMLIEEIKKLKPEYKEHLLTQMLLGKKLSLPLVDDEEV